MTAERQRNPQGVRIGGPEVTSEADHFYVCGHCKQTVDMRDLGQVFHHEEPGHSPIPNDDDAHGVSRGQDQTVPPSTTDGAPK